MSGGRSCLAVLGAGVMATAMVPRLRAAGFRLRLYNRTEARARVLAGPDDIVCPTPSAAAREADAVLSLVFDDEASRAVWFGPTGALSGARSGTLALELSTLSCVYVEDWARSVRSCGLRPVETPVTGSRPGAESGQLVVFAGAEHTDLAAAAPVLDAVAQEVIHLGAPGAAARFKLMNNLFAGTILAGMAECLAFARHTGLDDRVVVDVLSRHGWGSKVAEGEGREMLAAEYGDVRCALRTLRKDLDYALAAARARDLHLPVGQAVASQFSKAVHAGYGDLGMAAVLSTYPEPPANSRTTREAG